MTEDTDIESTGCCVPMASSRNSDGVRHNPYLYVFRIRFSDSVSDPCVGGVTSNLR